MARTANTILATDSYKLTHWRMYPPGTAKIGSYLESRGGEYDHTCFFGLQYLLDKHFSGVRITGKMIDRAEEFCAWHFVQDVFNRSGWEHILDAHGGRLPISIRAVPEGTVVPVSNVLLTVENTDPKVPWLTNHVETVLVQLWYPCTVATISRSLKALLRAEHERTGSSGSLPFALHDFGFRGSTSAESAALGGAAHLVNFQGTDNIEGVRLLMDHYGAGRPGFSVAAAEHSTVTSWGAEREADAYRHILRSFPFGTVSVVSDSWDVLAACRDIWGTALRDEIASNPDRQLVIRPDSGDPLTVLVQCLEILGERFGFRTNGKGFKVLPPNIRVLQGDGITRRSLPSILAGVAEAGWAIENLVFGSGGGLLQDCNRDTQKFALKCSWADIGGRIVDVRKAPASDPAKASKAGRLKLVAAGGPGGSFRTVRAEDPRPDELVEVFRDGEVTRRWSLDEIRSKAHG